jgi:hypothetical protein
MKTMIVAAALVIMPIALLAAESDEHVGTCFAYMMQNNFSDGARTVARMTTDLEAAQHYVMSALRSKVTVADGVAHCTKLGINMSRYKPPAIITTKKE